MPVIHTRILSMAIMHPFLYLSQVGKDQVEHYSEIAGKEVAVKDLVMYVVKFMMDKGMSLDNTEGMIDSAVFPVNYFTLKQV